MSTNEIIKKICENKGISVYKLEKDLGFSNGSIGKNEYIRSDRLGAIADYLGVSVDLLLGRDETSERYYLNKETSEMAQVIFENKEMRLLFDCAKDASPEDLQTVHAMLLALKRKEQKD